MVGSVNPLGGGGGKSDLGVSDRTGSLVDRRSPGESNRIAGQQGIEDLAVRSLVPILGLGLPVAWRSRSWSERDGGLRLRFVHRGGATDGMDVTWRIEPTEAGCRVSIEHVFGPRAEAWGVLIDRFFVRPIASRTLATFKAIAEAVAASEPRA